MEIHGELFVRREGEVDGRCCQMLDVELGRRRRSFLSVHSFTTRVITRCHSPMGADASAGSMSRVVGALALWKRPPTMDATGRRVRPTTVVNAAAGIGIVAVPIGVAAVGLVPRGQSAATVVLGIGFAIFGFIAFALYSFVWAGTKRATLAATVALAVAGIVALWLAVPALLDQLAGRNPF